MAAYRRHHYVPRFHLKKWTTAPDNKLTQFRNVNSRVVAEREGPRSVSCEEDLNAIVGASREHRQVMESQYFHGIDTEAADALTRLVDNHDTSIEVRLLVFRFLRSLIFRHPTVVRALREQVGELMVAACDELLEPMPRLRELIQKNHGLTTLSDFIDHEAAMSRMLALNTILVDCSGAKTDLLTCDRPVLASGNLMLDGPYTLAFAASPQFLIICFRGRFARDVDLTALVKRTNRVTVDLAFEDVYSTGEQHLPLVSKWLKPSSNAVPQDLVL